MLVTYVKEKDVNGDTLWVWCYPSVTAEVRRVLLTKCCLTREGRDLHPFVFGQFRRTWYYLTTVEIQEHTALKKVGMVMMLMLWMIRMITAFIEHYNRLSINEIM